MPIDLPVVEHLYWCVMYHHWQVDRHWPTIKEMFFGTLPDDQRDAVADEVRQQLIRDLHGHGMGRHAYEEVIDFARSDLKAIADVLGDGPFLFGDEPKSADAAIATQVLGIVNDPFESPLTDVIHAQKPLVPYAKRVLKQFFPEF